MLRFHSNAFACFYIGSLTSTVEPLTVHSGWASLHPLYILHCEFVKNGNGIALLPLLANASNDRKSARNKNLYRAGVGGEGGF